MESKVRFRGIESSLSDQIWMRRLQSEGFTITTKGKSQIVAVLNGETYFAGDYKDSGLYQMDLKIIRPLEPEEKKEGKRHHTKLAERAMASVGPKPMHQVIHSRVSSAQRVLERVHSDIAGPCQRSWTRKQYIITFTDKYSHFVTVYGIAKKSGAFDCFEDWYLKATAKHNLKMGMLVYDNGNEYRTSISRIISENLGQLTGHQSQITQNKM
eukprot:Ihof_evm1s1058 gene=Ihof_evmTU1s1058